jgi:hypothetical protein
MNNELLNVQLVNSIVTGLKKKKKEKKNISINTNPQRKENGSEDH